MNRDTATLPGDPQTSTGPASATDDASAASASAADADRVLVIRDLHVVPAADPSRRSCAAST